MFLKFIFEKIQGIENHIYELYLNTVNKYYFCNDEKVS